MTLYYKRFKIFTSNPLWQVYLKTAYKKSVRDLKFLSHNVKQKSDTYTVLLCGTSGFRTSEAFIKFQTKRNKNCHIIILDAADYPLDETKTKATQCHPSGNITYVKANALALPFNDQSIDHIDTDCFFQFFSNENLQVLLQEWKRILKDGGYISTRCFASNTKAGRIIDYLRVRLGKFLNADFHVHRYSTVCSYIKEAGLSFFSKPFWLPTLKRFTIIKSSVNTSLKYAVVLNSDNYFLPEVANNLILRNRTSINCIIEIPFKYDNKYLFANLRILEVPFILKLAVGSFMKRILSLLFAFLRYNHRKLSIRGACLFNNVSHHYVSSVNGREFKELLELNRVDIVLSFCSEIYREPILKTPTVRFYNFHPSILPNNKGRFPIFWAIYKDEPQGVTCHEITTSIDAGKILFHEPMNAKNDESMDTILSHYIHEFPRYLERAIECIESKTSYVKPSVVSAFYGPVPNLEQIRRYKKIVNWKKDRSVLKNMPLFLLAIICLLICIASFSFSWISYLVLIISGVAIVLYIYYSSDIEYLAEEQPAYEISNGLNGYRTHYQLSGSENGETVILIPGMSVPLYIWEPTFNMLVECGYRVLRYDFPGRGSSNAQKAIYDRGLYVSQLTSLLNDLNITKPLNIVAVSFGGLVAADFIQKHPHLVKKVVLIGAMYKMPNLYFRSLFRYYLRVHWRKVAKRQKGDFKQPENFPDWVPQYLKLMRTKGFRNAIISTLFDYKPLKETYRSLDELDKDVLIIYGKEDRTIKAKDAERVANAFRLPIVEVDDSGHLPHIEKPDFVNDQIVSFLRGVPQTTNGILPQTKNISGGK